MTQTELWVTNVGSHMWRMNRPDSDVDLFRCYAASTEEILSGIVAPGGTHFSQQDGTDLQSHEVGAWVEQLLKMNPNYLWGLFSPLVVRERGRYRKDLAALIRAGLSKQVYWPVMGMIASNRRKYVESGRDPSPKRINQMVRAGRWGRSVLLYGQPDRFMPIENGSILQNGRVVESGTPEAVEVTLERLDSAYRTSILPERVPEESVRAVRNWLLRVRLDELDEKL